MTDKITRYLGGLRRRTFPVSLHIALTDKCFNQCAICGHWRRPVKHELAYNKLEELLWFGAKHGLESVCFTGGDPLRYAMINGAMELCQKHGLDYGIVTAGYVPDKVELELLAAARWVRCSIDAAHESSYKKVRGGDLTWHQVERSLYDMHHAGCNLQVFTTVSQHNLTAIPQLYQWLKPRAKMFSELRARLAYKHTEGALKDPVGLLRGFPHRKQILEGQGHHCQFDLDEFTPDAFGHCDAVRYQLFIDADGKVYPCCIVAGDTELGSRAPSIGHIYESVDLMASAKAWAGQEYGHLPPICKGVCAPRFYKINRIVNDKSMDERNFF